MTVYFAADDVGRSFARELYERLEKAQLGVAWLMGGSNRLDECYADIAYYTACFIRGRPEHKAVLVCGTGIGMSIAANKVPGVYAALCHDTYSAKRAAESNGANIITMGSRVIGLELAEEIVRAWMMAGPVQESSKPKLAALRAFEEEEFRKK